MKNLLKILIVIVLFSSVVAFFAYAEEAKMPENVPAATATTSQVPSVPQTVVEKIPLDNLQTAYNFERNANVRYLAYAQKADAEGYSKAAGLFRAAARAEQVHFERQAKMIEKFGGVPTAKIESPVINRSTMENLKDALDGEIFESMIMYPRFLAQEENVNIKAEAVAFANAREADASHVRIFKFHLKRGVNAKDKRTDIYVCPVCANVIFISEIKQCPICGASRKNFIKVS